MLYLILLTVLGIAFFVLRSVIKTLFKYGPEVVVGRLALGRHPFHNPTSRHTNATFLKDSNGKVFGRPNGRVSKRHHRAGYKNLLRFLGYSFLFIGVSYGLTVERLVTVILVIIAVATIGGYRMLKGIRKAHTTIQTKAMVNPLGVALSSMSAMDGVDMEDAITLDPDFLKIKKGIVGKIKFPNNFEATEDQKRAVGSLVKSRFPYAVEIKWKTAMDPDNKEESLVSCEIVIVPPLPKMVPFRDHIAEIENLKRRQYIIGYTRNDTPFILDHSGDRPMKAYSMNSGTGKTTMLGSVAAQLLGNDPDCELTAFDVKRISLEFLRGVPGVTVYSNPKNLDEMWEGWYSLRREMDRRYKLMQEGKQTEFPDHWVILEEGNTFATMINGYWKADLSKRMQEKGNTPPLWYDTIAQILWQGREVNIFVIAVLQNFIERYFGNMSLRPSFGTIGMAGFKENQWRNIVQTTPIPVCQEGQGRMCIVDGPRQEWVQGLYGSQSELRDYAMKNRKGKITEVKGEVIEDVATVDKGETLELIEKDEESV